MFYWAGRTSLRQKLALVLAGTLLLGALFATTLADSGVGSQSGRLLLAGRDADTYENFSGRIPLWKLCMNYVSARPLMGYGFDSFWTPDHIRTISTQEGWAVPAAHNGFIDLMLGLGGIGLAFYLFQLAGTWRLLLRSNATNCDPFVRCYLALLVFYFACMFTETIAFDVGLPTFCVLSLFWSRKLWFRGQFASRSTTAAATTLEPVRAYQSGQVSRGRA
jgi:O-antigen ligase